MHSIVKYIKKNGIIILLILFSIFISFSLKTNEWNKEVIGVDSSVFITIGEKMHEGNVPYKDVFDHKGPILYFINYIGTIHNSYIFLYLIELLFIFIDLFILYKIAYSILYNKIVSLTAVLITVLLFPIMLQGGNFAEEYALPFMLLSLYIFLKKTKSKKDYFITGLCMGVIVLLKINMIQLWMVGYVVVVIEALKNKDIKEFFKVLANSFIGFLATLIPVFIYLILNGAFYDFVYQYIIFNMKYAVSMNISLVEFIKRTINMYYITYCVIALNFWQIVQCKKNQENSIKLIISLALLLITTIMIIFIKNIYLHYMIVLIPCYIIPVSYMLKSTCNMNNFKKYIIVVLLGITIVVFSFIEQYADRVYDKEYEVIERIKQIADAKDDVLVLGDELIVNILSETSTKCKYIYQYPIVSIDKTITDEVITYIENQKPDIIVMMHVPSEIQPVLDKMIEYDIYSVDNVNNCIIVKNGEV